RPTPPPATAAYTPPPGHGGDPPPSGGYPPPVGLGDGAPGHPAPRSQGPNGCAIAALIFGIIGGALLGYIFGFIALSQTKRTGQNGRGLALAGVILSSLWSILLAIST